MKLLTWGFCWVLGVQGAVLFAGIGSDPNRSQGGAAAATAAAAESAAQRWGSPAQNALTVDGVKLGVLKKHLL